MSKVPPSEATFTPAERDYIRRELDMWCYCIDRQGGYVRDRVARSWLEVVKALLPIVPHTMRTEVGRPKFSIRLSTWTATAISAFWRASVWECKPLPMTCLNRPIAASTRDRLL